MLSLPPSIRIFLARGVTDMRKQIDGLAGLVEHALKHDPFSGHLFVFCNRSRNRLKILYWEEGGYWLLHPAQATRARPIRMAGRRHAGDQLECDAAARTARRTRLSQRAPATPLHKKREASTANGAASCVVSIALAVDEQKSPEDIIAELRAENAALRDQRDLAQARLEALLHRLYGKATERYVDEGFGPLFEGQETPEPPPPHVDEAPDDEEMSEDAHARKPRRRGAPRLPEHIKRVIQDVEPSDEEKRCPCCGGEREVIGYEETEKLEYQPASCYLRVIRRPKLVCKAHEEAGVVTPDLPSQAIHKGLAGETMLAQVATAKYCDHLPLHRQAKIHARQGIDLPESTLCDWIAETDQLVRPIVDAMKARVLASGYVSTDDTGVTLLAKAGPKTSTRAHLWSYCGEERGDVVFDFTAGRGAEGPYSPGS